MFIKLFFINNYKLNYSLFLLNNNIHSIIYFMFIVYCKINDNLFNI